MYLCLVYVVLSHHSLFQCWIQKEWTTWIHNFYHAEITSVQRALQPITSHLPPTLCLSLHRCKDPKSFTPSQAQPGVPETWAGESNFPLQSLPSMGRWGLSSQPPQMSQTWTTPEQMWWARMSTLCTALGSGGGYSSRTGSLPSKQPMMVGSLSALWILPWSPQLPWYQVSLMGAHWTWHNELSRIGVFVALRTKDILGYFVSLGCLH